MSNAKKLSEREFTGDENYSSVPSSPEPIREEVPSPRVNYHIEYQVNGIEPMIDTINELKFRLSPPPSNKEVIDDLISKRPHLSSKRSLITILKTQAIRHEGIDKDRHYTAGRHFL